MEIITISTEYVDGCALIYKRTFSEEPWLETYDIDMIKEYFMHCCNDAMYGGYVAYDNKVYGFITYFIKPSAAGNVLYIDELCVTKETRKNGIGTSLINKVIDVSRQNSCISILIHTDKKTDAYRLYRKLDFEQDDSVEALYKNL